MDGKSAEAFDRVIAGIETHMRKFLPGYVWSDEPDAYKDVTHPPVVQYIGQCALAIAQLSLTRQTPRDGPRRA